MINGKNLYSRTYILFLSDTMVLNKIDTDTPEDRAKMTRKDIGLEIVRLKRARPMMDLDTKIIYTSMSELARELGMKPQVLQKKAKNTRGRIKFVYADDYPPYVDIQACETVEEYISHYVRKYYFTVSQAWISTYGGTVEEYISHYVRKYYFEFVQAMLPKMSLSAIKAYNNFRTSAGKPLVIIIDGDAIYDIYDDPEQPVFVCNVSDIGE